MRTKDPERVRLGRLGALTVHARGRTNVGPARAAWERALAAEHGITDDLEPGERERRVRAALRLRMTRLAMARWGNKKAGAAHPAPAVDIDDASVDLPPAA
jgi:hypothetical protein